MRMKKMGAAAAAVGLLAAPAVGLAAKTVHPANGKFTGKVHYKVSGKKQTGPITLTVAKHKLAGVRFVASQAPVDKRHSHGAVCGIVNDFTTTGYKVKGYVSRTGKFSYTFSQTFKFAGKVTGTDKLTVKGTFTDAKHAKGTFLDVTTTTAASGPGRSHCETGTLPFAGSHS